MAACNSYGDGPVVGANCFFYLNTGTIASPVWVEIGEITDFSIDDFSLNTAELKRRANNFTKNVAALFNSITLSFRMVHGLGKTEYDLVQDTFMDRVPIMALVADGDVASGGTAVGLATEILTLPILFTAFPWDQPLEDISGHDITATLAYYCENSLEVEAEWDTLAAA